MLGVEGVRVGILGSSQPRSMGPKCIPKPQLPAPLGIRKPSIA